jgi:hypothetical protein
VGDAASLDLRQALVRLTVVETYRSEELSDSPLLSTVLRDLDRAVKDDDDKFVITDIELGNLPTSQVNDSQCYAGRSFRYSGTERDLEHCHSRQSSLQSSHVVAVLAESVWTLVRIQQQCLTATWLTWPRQWTRSRSQTTLSGEWYWIVGEYLRRSGVETTSVRST